MANVRCLMVGGDGLIGSQLVEKLRSHGADVIATTRRKGGDDEHSRWLDLAVDPDLSWLNQKRDLAFLCAGVTNIALCEADPQMSYRVNVTNTLAIAKRLYALGMRIVFFSSNAVFDGQARRPDEDTAPCPSTEYGRQKVATEQGLMALSGGTGSVVIVRLSKVLTLVSGIIAEFMKRLAAHESCPALTDLRISPISLSYTIDSILAIAMSPHTGIFHLSGVEEMTYEEMAKRLAVLMAVGEERVQPLSSAEAKVTIVFRPENPALGMKRTSELLGIEPERSDYLLRQLVVGISS